MVNQELYWQMEGQLMVRLAIELEKQKAVPREAHSRQLGHLLLPHHRLALYSEMRLELEREKQMVAQSVRLFPLAGYSEMRMASEQGR